MDKEGLIKIGQDFVNNSPDNYINEEIAISQDLVGMKIFDPPIFAFASAEDEYFDLLKEESVVGGHFILPKDWLAQGTTVVSYFLPYSRRVREGNKENMKEPSREWLHGRIEGQGLINKLSAYLEEQLVGAGYDTIVPSLDKRFYFNTSSEPRERAFTSNWSERHVAFIAGHGSFGLSKGLITKRGVAGRFGSLITQLYIDPNKRPYKKIEEYCSRCGDCIDNCPVRAISLDRGKDHFICSKFLDMTKEKYKPRYGCGKCQVNVACEFQIPIQG